MKHAYLIMAHNEPDILSLLIKCIDDVRNDIFLHIDSKSDFNEITKNINVNFSKIFYINRNDVRWGDYSQIKTELDLFKYAYSFGNYRYFHLLSGVDLPIKTQDYIHNLFTMNDGKEFVKCWTPSQHEIYEKILAYNFFTKKLKQKYLSLFFRGLRKLLVIMQRLLHIKRRIPFELKKSDQWVSISNDFVSYLLSNEKMINKIFQHTCCGDEIFIPSILFNSPFKNNLYEKGGLRLVNWTKENKNSPLCFKTDDFERLKNSECIFARKFSGKNIELAENVVNHLALT